MLHGLTPSLFNKKSGGGDRAQGEWLRCEHFTPKAFHIRAQGRAAHPGFGSNQKPNPNGVLQWSRVASRADLTMPMSIPNVSFIDLQSVFLTEAPKLFLICFVTMMFLLVGNIFDQTVHVRRANRKCAIPLLPMEVGQ